MKNLPIDGNYINLQYGDVEEDILEAKKSKWEIDHQFAIISKNFINKKYSKLLSDGQY